MENTSFPNGFINFIHSKFRINNGANLRAPRRAHAAFPYPHVRRNRKREQQEEGKKHLDKYTEIERENRRLLEKIQRIMKSNKSTYVTRSFPSQEPLRRKRSKRPPNKNNELIKNLRKISFDDPSHFEARKHVKTNLERVPSDIVISPHSDIVISPQADRPKKLSPLVFDIKVSVYSSDAFIDSQYFTVEIFKGHYNVKILLINEDTDEQFSLEIPVQDCFHFMDGIEDWDKLISLIRFEGNELTLADMFPY